MTATQGEQHQLFFRLCSDHLSIEAIPKKPLDINLKKIKDGSMQDLKLLMWTPQFVVLRNQSGQEITLRKDGRMIIRKVASDSAARRAAAEVLSLVLRKLRK